MSQWTDIHPEATIGESVIWTKPDGSWELRVIKTISFDDSTYPNVKFQESRPQAIMKKLKSLFKNKSFKGPTLDKIYPLIDLERGHCTDLSRSYQAIGAQFNHGRDLYAEVRIADLQPGDPVVWFPGARLRHHGVLNIGQVLRIGTRSDVHHNQIFMAEVEFEDYETQDFYSQTYRRNKNGDLRYWDFVNVAELRKLGKGIEVLFNEYSTARETAGSSDSEQASTSKQFTSKPEPIRPCLVPNRMEISYGAMFRPGQRILKRSFPSSIEYGNIQSIVKALGTNEVYAAVEFERSVIMAHAHRDHHDLSCHQQFGIGGCKRNLLIPISLLIDSNEEYTIVSDTKPTLQSSGNSTTFPENAKQSLPGTSKNLLNRSNDWKPIKTYSECVDDSEFPDRRGKQSTNQTYSEFLDGCNLSGSQSKQNTNPSNEATQRPGVPYPNKHGFEEPKPKCKGVDKIHVPNQKFKCDEKSRAKYQDSVRPVSPDFRVQNLNLLETSDPDRNRGIYGIQGNRNSCYLDASIFALFSFSRTFDALLGMEAPDGTKSQDYRSEPPHTIRNILTEIVSELRGNSYVPSTSIKKLRAALALNDPRFLSECMDAEEFLLTMFKHLDVPDFFKFNNGAADQIHQLVVPDEQGTVLVKEVKTLIQDSFWYSEVELTDKPHPALILKLPFCDGMPLFGSKYVAPNLRIRLLDLGIKNREETEAMDLMAIICLRSSHYVCYAKTREGEMAPWVYFDSNPTQGLPQVQLLLRLELDLLKAEQNPTIFEMTENSAVRFENPDHMKLISSFAYICIYVPC